MHVVITGAAGFVGRAVVERLVARGDRVTALDITTAGLPQGICALAGDLADPAIRAAALEHGCDAVIHLATLPGGAAERDPAASRRINLEAGYDLIEQVAASGRRPRFVFASSIAVFGDPLPPAVDDATPLSPKLVYGGHKAMLEAAVTLFSNRGAIDGVTLRLPGILARPRGPSGMKSAFMSDLFHALKAGEAFTCPVSAGGTIWAQSVACCADNFVHALALDTALLPPTRAVTLPALRIAMHDLAQAIAAHCGVAARVDYRADAALERAFAAQPPLSTPAAERAGFAHDGALANLVARVLVGLA